MSKTTTIVIGATTPLSQEFDSPDTYVIGRDNKYSISNFKSGHDLSSEAGILGEIDKIQLILEDSKESTIFNLVHLQGVSTIDWEESINVNQISVAKISEAFCNWIEENNKTGSITLLGSASSYLGGKITYASTKASLFGIMNSLNSRFGEFVRTNIVVPGFFEGGMISDWDSEKIKKVSGKTFSNRPATTNEIYQSILFSIKNEYVCGAVINMSSGQIAIQ